MQVDKPKERKSIMAKRGRPKGSKNKPKTATEGSGKVKAIKTGLGIGKKTKATIKATRANAVVNVSKVSSKKRTRRTRATILNDVFKEYSVIRKLKDFTSTECNRLKQSLDKLNLLLDKQMSKSVEVQSETKLTSTPKKRGRPVGSKNKTTKIPPKAKTSKGSKVSKVSKVSTESTFTEFLQAGKIIFNKNGVELAGFPDVSAYKQTKRQNGLVDKWLLEQARATGIEVSDDADRQALNEALFGEGKDYTTAKKRRGRVSAPKAEVEKPKATKNTKNTKDTFTESGEPKEPQKRRGRPPKAKPLVEEGHTNKVESPLLESTITASKFLGYCPNGCDAVLTMNDQVGDCQVQCYRCANKILINDLCSETSREKPKSDKEYMESTVSLDFDIRPTTSMNKPPLFDSERVETLKEMSKDDGDTDGE